MEMMEFGEMMELGGRSKVTPSAAMSESIIETVFSSMIKGNWTVGSGLTKMVLAQVHPACGGWAKGGGCG